MIDDKWSLTRRKDNGRFVLTYVPPGLTWDKGARQKLVPKHITTEPRARAWVKETLIAIRAAGGSLPTSRQGLETLRDVYVDLMKVRAALPDIKRSTIANNWTHLRAQILGLSPPSRVLSETKDAARQREKRAKLLEDKRPAPPRRADPIADMPMSRVDVAEARKFVRRVRARCSPNHTRNVFSTARALWDTAKAEGKITTDNPFRNPMVVIEVPAARSLHTLAGELDPITVPLAIVQELLDAPDAVVPLQRRVFYALAFTSGMDAGELCGLTWEHRRDGVPLVEDGLVARAPYVEVRQQLSLRGKMGFATIDSPKTENRLRDVPLHPVAAAALEAWWKGWEQLVCKKPRPRDPIFVRENGRAWRPSAAEDLRQDIRALNARAAAAGRSALLEEGKLELVTFKAARRTFSSALKNAGVDVEDRGRLMGHSGSTVTARNYTSHELERLAGLVARIRLRWGTLQNPLCRGPELAKSGASSAGPNVAKGLEARIGFEPTYDGFAIGAGPLQAGDTASLHATKQPEASRTGIGHWSPDGKTQGSGIEPCRGSDEPPGDAEDAEDPTVFGAFQRAARGLAALRATSDVLEEDAARLVPVHRDEADEDGDRNLKPENPSVPGPAKAGTRPPSSQRKAGS